MIKLNGLRVMLTRSRLGNEEWAKQLASHGVEVICVPTIETRPLPSSSHLKQALQNLNSFDWMVFTSATGVHYFAKHTHVERKYPPVAAVGQRTASAVHNLGLKVEFLPSKANGQTLAQELPLKPGQRVLLLRAKVASQEITEILKSRSAEVLDLPLYETQNLYDPERSADRLLTSGQVDVIVFASPSAVRGLNYQVNREAWQAAKLFPVVAIGPGVQRSLEWAGFKNILVAARPAYAEVVKELSKLC